MFLSVLKGALVTGPLRAFQVDAAVQITADAAGAVPVVLHNMGVNGPYRTLLRAELEAMGAAAAADEPGAGGRAGSTSTHEIGRSVQSGLGVGGKPAPGGTLRIGRW